MDRPWILPGMCSLSRTEIRFTKFQGGVVYLSATISEENLFSSHLENSSSPQFQQLSQAVERKVRLISSGI